MEVINETYLDFTKSALKVTRKTELAKMIGTSTSTLDALYGVIDRNVSLDTRLKIRSKVDEQLALAGYVIKFGGVVRIDRLKRVEPEGGISPLPKPKEESPEPKEGE